MNGRFTAPVALRRGVDVVKFTIPAPLKIIALVLGATALYTYIGQLVPQKEVLPPVETVMSKEVYTVPRDSSAAAGASIMRQRKIHRLLVTDQGLLVGVVTSLDLLRVVEEG